MSFELPALPVTCESAASRQALARAAHEYLGWFGDPLATRAGAVEADPSFALSHALTGVLRLLSGEPGSSPAVQAERRATAEHAARLSPWEQTHGAAFEAWARGEIRAAAA